MIIMPIFEEFIYNPSHTITIYLLNGIMLEPKGMLEGYTSLANVNIYLVHYQRTADAEELVKQFCIHTESITSDNLIILVGFSSGGLVVHRLIEILKDFKRKIFSISIAPSHLKNFNRLKSISTKYFDKTSEEDGYKILKRMPWYVQNSSMPFMEIVNQLKFFTNDKIYDKPLGMTDIIVFPDQDQLCFDYETSLELSKNVLQVKGRHDISCLPIWIIIEQNIKKLRRINEE